MRLKERLLNYLLSYLYKSVTLKDLEESWDKLPETKKQQYFQEAIQLDQNNFYKWLSDEIEKSCMRRMYLQSNNEQDMIFGKAGLWIEDIRRKKLDNILRIVSQRQNSKKIV